MKKKSKWDKFLLLDWKRFLIIILAWIVAVVLHNLIYGLFKSWFDSRGGDEPLFFIIAIFIIPLYFLISLIYTLITYILKKAKA